MQDALANDLVWRKREFTTLKFLIQGAREHERKVLLRSAITLLYAHWEGHVKHCAYVYLLYLNHVSPKYNEMTDNFMQMSLGERFKNGFSIKRFSSQREIFNYILLEGDGSFDVNEKVVVDTESNLKYEVVLNILGQLGLDEKVFELKENFIDSRLVRFRNAVAHGEYVEIHELQETYTELEQELLTMIQTFQNLVINASENRSYLKS